MGSRELLPIPEALRGASSRTHGDDANRLKCSTSA